MQNKRLYMIVGVLIVIVAVAAFVGGRLLNGQAGPLGLLPFGNGGMVSISIRKTPAPELPTTAPDLTGLFVSRDDNTILLESKNNAGIRVVKSGDGAVDVSPADRNEGPKVEVVITAQTKIWRDATEFNGPPTSGEVGIQQKVEAGSLDDLNGETMLIVWGRRNGDRVIADVISYSNPVMFKK